MKPLERLSAGVKGGLRIGQTARVLGRTGLGWLAGDRPPTPDLMRQTFERLGTTYIKLGQFIASTPSIFPPEYVQAFQGCLDAVQPVPYPRIEAVLRREFDRPLDEVFRHIDREPLASASIAQVHKAVLVTGEEVVIKVQKPGVETILVTDFNFLYLTARVLERLAPQLVHASLSDIVDELQRHMVAECDFLAEAQNIETFRQFLRDTGNEAACAPRVYHQATTRRVLTMECFHGVPLTDLETIRQYCADPGGTLTTAMDTWIASLLQCQFFHADVHAGNLMVLEDGRVGFIDFGIVGRIRPGTWEALMSFMQGRALESYETMADALIRIGFTAEDVDKKALAADIEDLVHRMQRMEMALEPVDLDAAAGDPEMDQFLLNIVELGKKHGIRFPSEFALLLKQILYFDRYIQLLAPDLDMFEDERLVAAGEPALFH